MSKGYAIASELLPRGFGKRGGIFCPVCRQEAYSTGYSEEQGARIWLHEGRRFNCVRKQECGGTGQPSTNSTDAGNSVGSGSSSD